MICKECKEDRLLSCFSPCKRGKFGVRSICKICVNTKARQDYAKDPERFKSTKKAHYNSKKRRNSVLKKKFGITLEIYDLMLASQNSVCAICKKPECNSARYQDVTFLSIDHDHSTGKIRALLCGNCNRGLGLFYDNPDVLQAAKDYILKHQTTT